jgi:hypothetical protein
MCTLVGLKFVAFKRAEKCTNYLEMALINLRLQLPVITLITTWK